MLICLYLFIITIPGKKFKDKKDIGAFLNKTDSKRGLPNIQDHPKMNLSKNIIFSGDDYLGGRKKIRNQFRKSSMAPL